MKLRKQWSTKEKHECKQGDFSRVFNKIASESSEPCSHLVTNNCVQCLTTRFKSDIYNYVAPLITKTVNVRDVTNVWYDADVDEVDKKYERLNVNV